MAPVNISVDRHRKSIDSVWANALTVPKFFRYMAFERILSSAALCYKNLINNILLHFT